MLPKSLRTTGMDVLEFENTTFSLLDIFKFPQRPFFPNIFRPTDTPFRARIIQVTIQFDLRVTDYLRGKASHNAHTTITYLCSISFMSTVCEHSFHVYLRLSQKRKFSINSKGCKLTSFSYCALLSE